MNLGIKHLSQNITPNTSGILWLTDEDLDYKTPGVYEFNYLLDGILIKSISNKTDEHKHRKSNFFLGENFGSPLFIGHVKFANKNDLELIYEHFKVAQSFLTENSTIYIYNRSKNTANVNILKELSKKLKQYNFENLNI